MLMLNREYILINVLKALASIISMCNLHVTFLSKITLRYSYFTLSTNGVFRPFSVRWGSGCGTVARKINPLCLILIYFNIPALTPGLS
jgi:hypothetical protein